MLGIETKIVIVADEFPGEQGLTGTIKAIEPNDTYGEIYRVHLDGNPLSMLTSFALGEVMSQYDRLEQLLNEEHTS